MNHRAYVCRPEGYDLLAGNQFALLLTCGLRQHHRVLDVGCGSLCLGRLLIPFLSRSHYFGLEPELDLLTDGIEHEVGWEIVKKKGPQFLVTRDFSASRFGVSFQFVMAHSIFTHTHEPLAISALRQINNVLGPTGILLATFIESDSAMKRLGSGWEYPSCLAYTRGEIQRMFRAGGLEAAPLNFPHTCQSWWLARRPIS